MDRIELPPPKNPKLLASYNDYLYLLAQFRSLAWSSNADEKDLEQVINELTLHPYVHAYYGRSMFMREVNQQERTWRGSVVEPISDAYMSKITSGDPDVKYDPQKQTVEILNPHVINLYERTLKAAF